VGPELADILIAACESHWRLVLKCGFKAEFSIYYMYHAYNFKQYFTNPKWLPMFQINDWLYIVFLFQFFQTGDEFAQLIIYIRNRA
jgi:hypothetical protein